MFPSATLAAVPDELKWSIEPIPVGHYIEGWYAGPMVVLETHWQDPLTKPCRRFITEGKLTCRCDDEPMAVRKTGYVPLYTKANERFVIMVSETVAKLIERKKPGCCIKLARPEGYNKALTVTDLPDNHFGERLGKQIREACIFPIHEFLLHVWQDKELTEHFGFTYLPSCGSKRPAKKKAAAKSS